MILKNKAPAGSDGPGGSDGSARYGAGFFSFLLLLHILATALAGTLGPAEKVPAQRRELSLVFEQDFAPPPLRKAPAKEAPPERPAEPLQDIAEAKTESPPDAVFAAAEAVAVASAAASAEEFPAALMTEKPVMSEAEYISLIMKRLEENKIYPLVMRKRGIEGDAAVEFTILPDGKLGALKLGDAHPFLVQAAAETVKSASPFPVMEGKTGEYTMKVTIRYRLEGEGKI
ncbi:MAG: TonB family protein [Treponema sp.]|nr:TonB family protein [Treponema sp.]